MVTAENRLCWVQLNLASWRLIDGQANGEPETNYSFWFIRYRAMRLDTNSNVDFKAFESSSSSCVSSAKQANALNSSTHNSHL